MGTLLLLRTVLQAYIKNQQSSAGWNVLPCRGVLHPCALPLLLQWIEKVLGWLSRVFLQDGPLARPSAEASSTLRRWRCHVQRFFYRIYASMLIEELFSIIRGRCHPSFAVCALTAGLGLNGRCVLAMSSPPGATLSPRGAWRCF